MYVCICYLHLYKHMTLYDSTCMILSVRVDYDSVRPSGLWFRPSVWIMILSVRLDYDSVCPS